MLKQGIFRAGTSGIALPFSKEKFPQEYKDKSRLYYYSTIFNSIEINSSFYKVPRPATLLKWLGETTAGFAFTIKLWKEISHCNQLSFDEKNIRIFLEATEPLSMGKGCLLIQFPGKINFDYFRDVENILESIVIMGENKAWRIAIEFRHPSWYTAETNELLKEHNATMVLQDHYKTKNLEPQPGAGFYYFRYHGPAGDYRGSYDPVFLKEQSKIIRSLIGKGKDVYAYFNNTLGNAFENAIDLQQLVNYK